MILRKLPTASEIAAWLDPVAFEPDPKDLMNKRRIEAFERGRIVYQRLFQLAESQNS